MKLAENITHHH